MKFGSLIGIFLNSANLICRSTDISKCFRGSLRLRDKESRLYIAQLETRKGKLILWNDLKCFSYFLLVKWISLCKQTYSLSTKHEDWHLFHSHLCVDVFTNDRTMETLKNKAAVGGLAFATSAGLRSAISRAPDS